MRKTITTWQHGHSHDLVDRSIVRSRAGLKAVSLSLATLGAAALVQAAILVLTGSVALLADLIHNVGDALTAVPIGIAFLLRSFRAEKIVVLAIFVSACVAQIRLRAGKRLSSPALIADGNHARVDGFVSLGVVASAIAVALCATVGDPIIGLLITAVILKISWDSWRTVSTSQPGELLELHEH